MNIACASCPAKYAVPDDKVRGRKVRITCKRCGAAIIVDGTSLGASGAPSAAEPAAPSSSAGGAEPSAPQPSSAAGAAAEAKPSDANRADAPAPNAAQAPAAAPANEKPPADGPKVGPAVEPAPAPVVAKTQLKPLTATLGAAKPLASVAKQPAGASEAKIAFPKPGAATGKIGGLGKAATAATAPAASAGATTTQAARAVSVPRATAAARAVAPSALPERTWTVAITDDDHREMTLAQVVDAYAAETIDSETFIWREGMQDWLMPFEIAEIAAALRARRLSPRASSPGSKAGEPFGQEPAGAWREPGRWDRDEPSPDEPSFDDVTVAMEAPKAKALLQAVAFNEEAPPAAAPAPAAGAPARVVSKNDEPTTVGPPFAVTPEALGFGGEEGASAKAEAADAPAAERVPEKLPFELSQSPARAALKVAPSGAEPRDLFARSAGGDESPAEPKDTAAPSDDSPVGEAAPEDGDAEAKALTGARNESSVLFSLDQLSRAGAKPAPAGKKKKTDEAALLLGGSGTGTHEIAPVAGGLFGQANMAAPDFTAPPPPSVPPPANKRQPTSSAPTSSAPRPASGAGKWIGLAVGLVVIGGGAFFLTRSPAPAPAPSATAAPAVATTPPPSLTASAAAEPSATAPAAESPAENASAAAAATGSAAPTAAASAAGTAAAAPGATAPAGTPTGAVPAAPAGTPKPQATATAKPTAAASAAAAPAPAEGPDFDKDAAAAALATAASRAEGECGASEGPHGTGKVAVTFANSGRATNALVSGDFAGSALGGCVARIFRGVKVPAFGGEPVRVSKTVRIP